jgi:CheY-like chemotaxis protein
VNILVVESEDTTRELMGVMFTKLGYKATLASNYNHAVALLSEGRTFDVVLIALKFMRGSRAGGARLIDQLLEKNPTQQFAFITSTPVLHKPFTLQEVDDFMGAFRRPGQSRFS